MPGFELIDNNEKEALNSLFDEGGVLFAHGFDGIRKNIMLESLNQNYHHILVQIILYVYPQERRQLNVLWLHMI